MIRKMQVNDLDRILIIENESFSNAYHKQQFLYELEDNPCANLYVVEINHTIVGYIDYWITFDTLQLTKIAVSKQERQKGYAQMMMKHMIHDAIANKCETILLEVRISNKEAQRLYKKNDFLKINIRKGYYSDNNEDAIVMGKVVGGL